MKKIQQLENSRRLALAWYGNCEVECEDYDLMATENEQMVSLVDHIYEIKGSDSSMPIYYSAYTDHIHDTGNTNFNSFKMWSCLLHCFEKRKCRI